MPAALSLENQIDMILSAEYLITSTQMLSKNGKPSIPSSLFDDPAMLLRSAKEYDDFNLSLTRSLGLPPSFLTTADSKHNQQTQKSESALDLNFLFQYYFPSKLSDAEIKKQLKKVPKNLADNLAQAIAQCLLFPDIKKHYLAEKSDKWKLYRLGGEIHFKNKMIYPEFDSVFEAITSAIDFEAEDRFKKDEKINVDDASFKWPELDALIQQSKPDVPQSYSRAFFPHAVYLLGINETGKKSKDIRGLLDLSIKLFGFELDPLVIKRAIIFLKKNKLMNENGNANFPFEFSEHAKISLPVPALPEPEPNKCNRLCSRITNGLRYIFFGSPIPAATENENAANQSRYVNRH